VTRIAIVGAGFGGIAVAHHLRRAGFADLTVFDRGDVGGVWRDNAYPGCACDIPAPLYSYSFALNPDWSRRFPPRAEILAYLRRCVEDLGLTPYLRLRTGIAGATWTGTAWRVEREDGGVEEFDVLIPAVGQLSRPLVPALPGAADFAGPALHTARWDPELDLAGRRVGVVGTGASAVQLVPAVAGNAARVTVFQRTPPWTLPKPDRRYGRPRRALYRRFPSLMRLARGGTWALTVVTGLAVTGNPVARAVVSTLSRTQRRLQARDLAGVRPDYAMGCKRVLFTGDWFRTLRRPDVDLVTADIAAVEPTGVRTADGTLYECDVLVYGTGFAATDFLAPMRVDGRGGVSLAGEWRDGAYAHLGIAVPGFPNMFLMYGPNTNTGNTSVIYFHEAQARYIVEAVRAAAARGPIEVRAEVAAEFDAEMRRRLSGSVWTGCDSWYRGPGGRVVTNWPGTAGEYGRRTARLRGSDYVEASRLPAG
jgi:cation diffusion facilitator CzcD-associated flavoprotein CzcO